MFVRQLLTLITLTLTSAKSTANIKRQITDESYDFIIAGGGTAGLLLANRLSENPTQRVLVVEAGPEPTVVKNYEFAGGNQYLGGTAVDWNFYTTNQENLHGRSLVYRRGKGLGGSSIINGIYYGRGSASVYDRWVKLGNPGWGWDDLYPLSVQHTHFNPPNNKSSDQTYQTWDPEAYSNGPLEIGFQGDVPNSCVGFMNACEAIGIPIVNELNTGNNTGIRQGTGCLDSKYRRSSSYDSFYKQAEGRPNLDVLYYAVAQAIQFGKTGNGTTRATGITYIDEQEGLWHVANATKEVIVSMGAFQTPQFLMVSGIGPKQELVAQGIAPVYINENVGQHLNDHSLFSVYALSQASASRSNFAESDETLTAAQQQYNDSLTGPWTAPSGITNGFQQLSNDTLRSIGAQGVLDAGLVNQSHVEFLYESIYYPAGPSILQSDNPNSTQVYYQPQANLSYFSVTAQSLVALSRGNVTLRGADMFAQPVINPNYYADPTDRAMAIHAFKDLRKLLAHPALSNYTIGPNNGEVCPGFHNVPENATDDAIFSYIAANTVPNWHASGTAQMLPEADGGVVDARLRVYGVEGLRVCDVSIIPRLPDVNTQGPVFMIADRGAQIIQEDHGL